MMNSHWKRKNEPDKVEHPETPPTVSESLEEGFACYKLMNGTKIYFQQTYPHEFSFNKQVIFNILPIPIKFAGELNNTLYFYAHTSGKDDLKTESYAFYEANRSKSDCFSFKKIREITTEREIKFAVQQPYLQYFDDKVAVFESFGDDQMRLNDYNSEFLTRIIDPFAFFVWKEFVAVVTINSAGKCTAVTPGVFFLRQLCHIQLRHDLPLPTSLYGQDNSLLYMLCGYTVLVFNDVLKSVSFEIDILGCHIGGVDKRRVFINAPGLHFSRDFTDEQYRAVSWIVGKSEDEGYESKQNTSTDSSCRSQSSVSNGDSLLRYTESSRSNDRLEIMGLGNEGTYSSEFLEKFTVIDIRGEGGFGCVLEVANRIDSLKYAVKRIAVEATKMGKALAEVRTLAKL
ncbi:hypothetical protein PENTCL1PPCAC_8524, partial [Pristionchus entomophagus]